LVYKSLHFHQRVSPYGTNINHKIQDFDYYILYFHISNCTLPLNICMFASVQLFTVGNSKFQSSGIWCYIPGWLLCKVLKKCTEFMIKWWLFHVTFMVQDEANMLLRKEGNHSPMTKINIQEHKSLYAWSIIFQETAIRYF